MARLWADQRSPVVTGIKGQTGHTAGASGLMSAVMAAFTLATGRYPGIHHLERPLAAGAGLGFARGAGTIARPRYAQVNAFGFGGLNAVAILERTVRP
jgi:3-oxoacyl-[acyl-carrier-protein] synthase II